MEIVALRMVEHTSSAGLCHDNYMIVGDVFTNVSRQSIKKAALLQNSEHKINMIYRGDCVFNYCHGFSDVQMQEGAEQQPLVILRPACIHPHPPPSSPSLSPSNHHHHHHHQRARGEQGSDGGKTKKQLPRVGRRGGLEMPPATQTEWQERDEREKTHVHHPLSQEEMLQANIAIEKQRYIIMHVVVWPSALNDS